MNQLPKIRESRGQSNHTEFYVRLVEVLLYVHRNRRLIRDGSPGLPPQLTFTQLLFYVSVCVLHLNCLLVMLPRHVIAQLLLLLYQCMHLLSDSFIVVSF